MPFSNADGNHKTLKFEVVMFSNRTRFSDSPVEDTNHKSQNTNQRQVHLFLAVQNSSIGDLVTQSVSHSLLLLPYKEQSKTLATIDTFDQSDEVT